VPAREGLDSRSYRPKKAGGWREKSGRESGYFCYRKGAQDFHDLVQALGNKRFSFRWVGPVTSDALPVARGLKRLVTFTGKLPQARLAPAYEWGDVFLFPTLEDGFAAVLTQALASGLPLLATTNCAASDLIREGEQGWVVPIRSPDKKIDRLRWCDEHRKELARVVRNVYQASCSFDWADTARLAEANLVEFMKGDHTTSCRKGVPWPTSCPTSRSTRETSPETPRWRR
jgi:glycosyltransferase involved in cell wall biosynthesis